ncbi:MULTISPECIES: hypothetical protein [Streptomycetaceae]|uniref:hypothetical protein n=1 Tax=Streptomycetaceae TaxID=2062 RepID=UPI00300B2BF9
MSPRHPDGPAGRARPARLGQHDLGARHPDVPVARRRERARARVRGEEDVRGARMAAAVDVRADAGPAAGNRWGSPATAGTVAA